MKSLKSTSYSQNELKICNFFHFRSHKFRPQTHFLHVYFFAKSLDTTSVVLDLREAYERWLGWPLPMKKVLPFDNLIMKTPNPPPLRSSSEARLKQTGFLQWPGQSEPPGNTRTNELWGARFWTRTTFRWLSSGDSSQVRIPSAWSSFVQWHLTERTKYLLR